jgi:hypothetical protein
MRNPIGLLALMLTAALAQRVPAEENVSATRRLWDDAFRQKRVEARENKGGATTGEGYLGLTVWRLRRAAPGTSPDSLVRLTAEGGEWLAESVLAGTRFAPGERLRLGIESARRGYLYVFDAEEYADGSRGEPHLVFPTTRTRGGDNRVAAGRLIEIPDVSDTPPYFSIKVSRENHVADVLTILVTPRPLDGVRPGREPLPIAKEQLAGWERAYGAPASRLDLPHAAARPYTPAERAAASSSTRLLAHDDPLPQTLFRVDRLSGGGLWVQLSLGMLEKSEKEKR